MRILNCPQCKKDFETRYSKKKYCSKECQMKFSHKSAWMNTKLLPSSRCRKLYEAAKNRAKSKGLDFDISVEYMVDLWNQQEGKCLISGIEFDMSMPDDGLPLYNAPSLDRVKPSLGYVKGNVRLVCYQVNTGMQHYGGEHFISLCKTIVNYNGGMV